MNIEIRRAREEDVNGLDIVMQVISDGPGKKDKMVELIGQISKDPQKYLMVAVDEDNERIVGSLFGVIFEDICGDGRPILLVENVAVLETFQGKGIGKLMFEKIEEWGRKMQCHYEILVSGNGRVGAHQFYNKIGFEQIKGFKKYL